MRSNRGELFLLVKTKRWVKVLLTNYKVWLLLFELQKAGRQQAVLLGMESRRKNNVSSGEPIRVLRIIYTTENAISAVVFICDISVLPVVKNRGKNRVKSGCVC